MTPTRFTQPDKNKPMAQAHQEFKDPALSMAVRIPSPPPLLDELNRLLDDPNSEMDAIAKVVQSDAGLTARLFRTLAKPSYGLRKPSAPCPRPSPWWA